MSISSANIKFMQPERLTDFDDGGGEMSANEILDNQMNNVFSDRSDLDAILGRVSLRELFLWINTTNNDPFLGSFVFLTDPPLDPLVSVCLFNIGEIGERIDAQSYVEAYRIIGVKSQFILYGDHFTGQQTIQVYCRPDYVSPDIGDVLALSIEAVGFTNDVQFVQVRSIASRLTQTFTDSNGDFTRDVLIIQITSSLKFDFPGQDPPQRLSGVNPPATKVRFTQVSSGAKYYGLKPVTTNPSTGDLQVVVDDPYVPIVPSTQAETPLVDQLAGLGTLSFTACSAAGALTYSATIATTPANTNVLRYFGTPYCPGSLNITVGSVTLKDDGSGGIAATDPTLTGWTGTADYASGSFTITKTDSSFGGVTTASATAAAVISLQGYNLSILVTATTRGISYVFQLPNQASPGTGTLDYLSLGKWIRLSDDGLGHLSGNPGEGSGTINYATGSVSVTLGALPDVDSALIVSWGTDTRVWDSHGGITVPAFTYRQQLSHGGIDGSTLTVSWLSGGVTKTATCTDPGVLSGNMSGNVDIQSGLAEFTTSFPLDAGHQFQWSYNYVDPSKVHQETFTPSPSGHTVSISVAHAPVQAGSVTAQWTNTVPHGSLAEGARTQQVYVHDNASGGFTGAITGTNTINYTTGAIVLTVDS